MSEKPTVIEKTSKKLKGQQLIAVGITIIGFIFIFSTPTFGALAFFGGLIYFIIVRVVAWWEHG